MMTVVWAYLTFNPTGGSWNSGEFPAAETAAIFIKGKTHNVVSHINCKRINIYLQQS